MKMISLHSVLLFFISATAALAMPLVEIESNDTISTAQSIDAAFSATGTDPEVHFSGHPGWEWVSISGTGDDTYDFYSFVAQENQIYVFDVDHGSEVDDTD